jgi:very-short-patch-repair endonuclease
VDLVGLSLAQAGAFSRAQAMSMGYRRRTIERRLAAGEWCRILPWAGIYVHATFPVRWETHVWAAVLGVGEPVAVGVGTAAGLWSWAPHRQECVELLVPVERCLATRPGVHVRRLQVERGAITRLDRLPITSPARTAADCLRFLPAADAVRILDRAQQVSRVDLSVVVRHLPPHGRGAAQARRLLAAATGEHSAAERIATALLRQARIRGWRANYAIRLEGRRVVIDIAFPASKVAVEIDGWAFHVDADAFQQDRQRQNLLVRHGWRVLRFTYRDLIERPQAVIAEIIAATGQSTD